MIITKSHRLSDGIFLLWRRKIKFNTDFCIQGENKTFFGLEISFAMNK